MSNISKITVTKKAPQNEYKSGDLVETSGLYQVIHDKHAAPHEVTSVKGEPFPPCRDCGYKARFMLVRPAIHLTDHDLFKGVYLTSPEPARMNLRDLGSPRMPHPGSRK